MTTTTSIPPSTEEAGYLAENGILYLRELLTPDEMRELRRRSIELAERERVENPHHVYLDGKAQRVWNLVNKGEIFERLIQHPRLIGTMEHLLGADCVLSSFTVNLIEPGAPEGGLHVDFPIGGLPKPLPEFPLTANSVWFLDDFTEANGATYVVPGSHKWRCPPDDRDAPPIQLVGKAGTVAIVQGGVWHGNAPNRSSERRTALLGFFCRAFVKQQQNHLALATPEVLERATPLLRRLMGYDSQSGMNR